MVHGKTTDKLNRLYEYSMVAHCLGLDEANTQTCGSSARFIRQNEASASQVIASQLIATQQGGDPWEKVAAAKLKAATRKGGGGGGSYLKSWCSKWW